MSAPLANSILVSHLKSNRIAHTYLFSGPEGPIKKEWVTGFAKALNCEQGKIFRACECLSCRKIEKGIHPDVRWFGEDEKARSLKIEEVRTLLHEASLKPYEGRWKVFILVGAERLTLEAANALLKTLEEPPEHSVFLLLVEQKAHLLVTIQSRSLEIRVPPTREKDPRENEAIQLYEREGAAAFFESLKEASRVELLEILAALMLYLRNRFLEVWEKEPQPSQCYLDAIGAIYETQEAVEANVNQKLALTHLEIHLEKVGGL